MYCDIMNQPNLFFAINKSDSIHFVALPIKQSINKFSRKKPSPLKELSPLNSQGQGGTAICNTHVIAVILLLGNLCHK